MSRTSHNNRPKVGNTLEMGFSPLTTSVRNSDHGSTIGAARVPRTRRPRQNGTPPATA